MTFSGGPDLGISGKDTTRGVTFPGPLEAGGGGGGGGGGGDSWLVTFRRPACPGDGDAGSSRSGVFLPVICEKAKSKFVPNCLELQSVHETITLNVI